MTFIRPTKLMLALAALVLLGFIPILHFLRPTSMQRPAEPAHADYPELPQIVHHHPPPPPQQWSLLDKLFGSPPAQTSCSTIPIPENYWETKDAFTPAFVSIPNNRAIKVGESVCVRVVVPAKPSRSEVLYTPFPNTPWDSIMIDLIGTTTNISIPIQLRMANDIRNTWRDHTHVYEADVRLRDPDEYRLTGYIEFRDAQWNPDGGLQPIDYNPEPIYVPETLSVVVHDDVFSPYSLSRYLELPLCSEPDSEGRWVHVDQLPFSPELVLPAENHNLTWLPYNCRLQPIRYQDFATCLSTTYPLMHWYGDSNIRRSLKKITTMGEWCSNSTNIYSNGTETRSCLCEDYSTPFKPFDARYRELILDLDQNGGHALEKPTDYSNVPAGTARMYLHKWEGLSYRNKPEWKTEFKKGITSRYGRPQMALISLTNWDAAFSSRTAFAVELSQLLEFVEKEYPPTTQLYIRTGQYYCCRSDKSPKTPRSYSRLRNAYFNQYVVDTFMERFGSTHQIHIWDVSSISERLPHYIRKENVKCPANHARAEVVEIENQVLMNAMCGR
ncbi:hypothetical protein LPJ78_001950 [Coemansia sp. RSA 989]|nr:hypothetical protein BX667DRAFT_99878 [Coemansia mojavensis]KAJ1751090.1 hypothetical protein LPJ79_002367 [Coemansia sp. RSA 1821]KAJ1866293.1 hypothetical protein LPJ78_001950 [Coemansia sp. RSA 989]KAJ1872464.1 hypothetical protein LPJ55_003082 [Coemansia sp. RSA 990]KAJ2633590.1 hypothetical protein H4R22_000337 [Coemansia sp. RSA 1290]KAJ2653047.1 hypothetical protein IWW40_000701 [Coemansia sp. RSA 1250]KAJ2676047.1 hypothetical protein IWW42_000716 [Coemansia sp. RSA 1085]